MLKFMRAHLGRTVLLVIIGAISVVFVLWGVFPETRMGAGMGATTVASVADEKITARDLAGAVEREVENYRAMGMELPNDPSIMSNIRQGVLERLVSNKLMLVEARRLGIQASDREVRDEIQRIPAFQDKEKKTFSVETYRQLLAANNLPVAQFEENVREGLTNQRMMKFLESRIRVTPVEVEREFEISNNTRNLQFVRFTREDAIKKMKVSPQELTAFLADKNREPLVASYYAQNSGRFNQPETICARHILKRFAPGATPAQAVTPPKTLTDLKPAPGNFAELAKKHSEDPGTQAKGGDLQCFPRGQGLDPAFEQAAFSTAVGKVSAPVQSKFGWHYVYVYKKNAGTNRPLDKVRQEIAEELIKRDKIAEISAINVASAQAALKAWPPKGAELTGPFNGLESAIPKIGRADEILKAAFDPTARIQSGPQLFESAGGVIVAMVKEKKSPDMSKLAKEKDLHARTLKERKLRAFMPAWMQDVQKRTKVSYNSSLLSQM